MLANTIICIATFILVFCLIFSYAGADFSSALLALAGALCATGFILEHLDDKEP